MFACCVDSGSLTTRPAQEGNVSSGNCREVHACQPDASRRRVRVAEPPHAAGSETSPAQPTMGHSAGPVTPPSTETDDTVEPPTCDRRTTVHISEHIILGSEAAPSIYKGIEFPCAVSIQFPDEHQLETISDKFPLDANAFSLPLPHGDLPTQPTKSIHIPQRHHHG